MQGLDSVSKIMKKIIPNFSENDRCIFPNLCCIGPVPKTMIKNADHDITVLT